MVIIQEYITGGDLSNVVTWTAELWRSVVLQLTYACMEIGTLGTSSSTRHIVRYIRIRRWAKHSKFLHRFRTKHSAAQRISREMGFDGSNFNGVEHIHSLLAAQLKWV